MMSYRIALAALSVGAGLFLGAAGPSGSFMPTMVDGKPLLVHPMTPICEDQPALHAALTGKAPPNCLVFKQPIPAHFDRPLADAKQEDQYIVLLPGDAVVNAWTASKDVGP
jgi:hypothetical protein